MLAAFFPSSNTVRDVKKANLQVGRVLMPFSLIVSATIFFHLYFVVLRFFSVEYVPYEGVDSLTCLSGETVSKMVFTVNMLRERPLMIFSFLLKMACLKLFFGHM